MHVFGGQGAAKFWDAHFAAGIGGFAHIDLDTPLWLKKEPTRGLRLALGFKS